MRAVLVFAAVSALATVASAGSKGVISTDRFGYTGAVYRYATLADAQADTNRTNTYTIGNRDLSVYNSTSFDSQDYAIMMGSWWYTTTGPGLGWGNTTGNTGAGFLQMYDIGASTVSSASYSFGGFDGTYFTEFSHTISGTNALPGGANESARFTAVAPNSNDSVIFHNYNLSLTATGLQGMQLSPGVIEATNHPTGVSGSFTGVFENQTASANNGFYRFALTLDMVNWAYANRNSLVEINGFGSFSDSYFAVVPLPAAAWAGLALLGVAGVSRRRNVA
jgi:hypothetical protein